MYEIRYIIFIGLLMVVVSSCSTTQSITSATPAQKEQTTVDKSKSAALASLHLQRSNIDSLEAGDLLRINQILKEQNSKYLRRVEYAVLQFHSIADSCQTPTFLNETTFDREFKSRSRLMSLNVYPVNKNAEPDQKASNFIYDQGAAIESAFFEDDHSCNRSIVLHKTGMFYTYQEKTTDPQHVKNIDLIVNYMDQIVLESYNRLQGQNSPFSTSPIKCTCGLNH